MDDPSEEAPAFSSWCLCWQLETNQEWHIVEASSRVWRHHECALWWASMWPRRFGFDEQHCLPLLVLPWSYGSWQRRGRVSWCPYLCWAKSIQSIFRFCFLLNFCWAKIVFDGEKFNKEHLCVELKIKTKLGNVYIVHTCTVVPFVVLIWVLLLWLFVSQSLTSVHTCIELKLYQLCSLVYIYTWSTWSWENFLKYF